MKKNFNVNIAGIIFHMDEDAFEKLDQYLHQLRRHFAHMEGHEEILSDIESRIAEMLTARLGDARQVVTLEDIENATKALGEPTEWGDESQEPSDSARHRPKRLYRDPDNKIIGGVCSGLGTYFNLDPLWIRLAFVVITIAGFGTGIIAYFLLWIVAPEARSTAEKLEMKGEKVTVSNIEKSIREEFQGIKGRLNELTDDAKQAYQKNASSGMNFFEKVFRLILQILGVVFRVVVVFFGLIAIAAGLFLIIGFLFSMVDSGHEIYISSFGISTFSLPAMMRLFLDSRELTLGLIGVIMLIGIPLALLVYIGARLIFRFKSPSRFIGIPAFALMLAGLAICVIVGMQVFRSFSQKAVTQEFHMLKQPVGGMLTIDLGRNEMKPELNTMEDQIMIGNWNIYHKDDTTFFFGIPKLEISRASNDSFGLQIYTMARGERYEMARLRAKNIRYHFSQTDSSLVLDPYFFMPLKDKIRGQEVKIVVKVPQGRKIFMKEETEAFFNAHRDYDHDYLPGHKWLMTDRGLKETEKTRTDTLDFQPAL